MKWYLSLLENSRIHINDALYLLVDQHHLSVNVFATKYPFPRNQMQ